ncbi:MAG: hypothetical protein DI623_13880 [Sphingomonas sanxanigenens]|uniref:Uncharacterized protein n=1 Tax=Sphingomonas sanxanigenens TaxID=397260 RepID=A0A2W5A5Y0_9SPHN|nr:MAG: hypothetical protein DI623_13880 [Sphingomonas sanxanigenens]
MDVPRWPLKLALFATYSVDLSAVAAALLALIARNNDKGSGTAVDFAEAIDKLRDRVRIIIQRGRIARPIALQRTGRRFAMDAACHRRSAARRTA